MVSTDGGATFTAPSLTDPSGQSYGYLSQIGNLLDGRLLAVRFVANAGGVSYNSTTKVTTFPLKLSSSQDKGRTWTPLTASVSFTDAQIPSNLPLHTGANIRGISAAGRPIQMTDGTLVVPIYVVDLTGHDTLVGSLPKQDSTAFASLSGYGISSGGATSVGDEAVMDDISFDTP